MSRSFDHIRRRTELAFRLEGHIRGGFVYRDAGHEHIREWYHSDYSMVYVMEGQGVYEDASGTASFGPGDVLQRLPELRHTVRFSSASPVWQTCMGLPGTILPLLEATVRIPRQPPVFHVGMQVRIPARMEELLPRLRREPESVIAADLHTLMAEIHSLRMAPANRPAAIEEACDLLEQSIAGRESLEQVAAAVGMAYSSFRKAFTRYVGMPPGEYQIHRRLERAQVLLCNTDTPVKQVAAMLGYADVYTFSRQFKSFIGTSPGRFRRLHGR